MQLPLLLIKGVAAAAQAPAVVHGRRSEHLAAEAALVILIVVLLIIVLVGFSQSVVLAVETGIAFALSLALGDVLLVVAITLADATLFARSTILTALDLSLSAHETACPTSLELGSTSDSASRTHRGRASMFGDVGILG